MPIRKTNNANLTDVSLAQLVPAQPKGPKMSMPAGAYVWYIIINIFTFGIFYFYKITLMKAMIDANNTRDDI